MPAEMRDTERERKLERHLGSDFVQHNAKKLAFCSMGNVVPTASPI